MTVPISAPYTNANGIVRAPITPAIVLPVLPNYSPSFGSGTLIQRDNSGLAEVGTPTTALQIANKGYVDSYGPGRLLLSATGAALQAMVAGTSQQVANSSATVTIAFANSKRLRIYAQVTCRQGSATASDFEMRLYSQVGSYGANTPVQCGQTIVDWVGTTSRSVTLVGEAVCILGAGTYCFYPTIVRNGGTTSDTFGLASVYVYDAGD